MLDARHDIAFCGAARSKFIGDPHARRMALSLQELFHQTLCGPGITAALNQTTRNEALLINSAPEPMFLSANRDDDLVEMPFVTGFAGCPSADAVSKGPPEFLRP